MSLNTRNVTSAKGETAAPKPAAPSRAWSAISSIANVFFGATLPPAVNAPLKTKDPKGVARKEIEAAKEKSLVSWQQFAHAYDPMLIKGSAFDRGGQTLHSLKAYIGYLETLDTRPRPFFAGPHDKNAIKRLKAILESAKDILEKFPPAIFGELSNEACKLFTKNILKYIDETLKNKKYVYVPIGYVGKKPGEGHAMACEILQDEHHTTVSYLNLGAGVENHADLGITGTHYTVSLSSYHVVLPNSEWDKKKEKFFAAHMRFIADTPKEDENNYTAEELYDLLKSLGKMTPKLVEQEADQLQECPQFIGDCSERVPTSIMIRASRHHLNMSADDVQRLFLNFALLALLAAHHSYKKNPNAQRKALLENAAQRFGQKLDLNKHLITEEEYAVAIEIQDQILQEIKKIPIPATAQPPKQNAPFDFPKVKAPRREKMEMVAPKFFPLPTALHLLPHKFEGDKIKEQLGAWVERLKKCGSDETLTVSILDSLSSLPVPKWGVKDEWDTVPPQHINEILRHFDTLISMHNVNAIERLMERPQILSILSTLYACVDKLARRDLGNKLDGFASPFSPENYDDCIIFLDPSDEERYLAAKEYFQGCKKACNSKEIFPLSLNLPIKVYFDEMGSGKMTQGANHLRLLTQFSGELNSAEKYTDFWLSNKLPEAVQILYNMVYRVNECSCSKPYFFHETLKFEGLSPDTVGIKDRGFPLSQFSDDSSLVMTMREMKQSEINKQILTPFKATTIDGGISSEQVKELAMIGRHRNLAFAKSFMWMKKNRDLLGNEDVQKVISTHLFSPGAMRERLLHNREESGREIWEFIEEEFARLDEKENVSSLLFLIRLALSFESHLAYTLKKPIDLAKVMQLRIKLVALTKHFSASVENEERSHFDIQLHLLYLDQFIPMNSLEQFINLYTRLFTYRSTTWSSWNLPEGDKLNEEIAGMGCDLGRKYWLKLQTYLSTLENKQQEALNHLCNEVIKQVVGKEVKSGLFEMQEGIKASSKNPPYTLSFLTGRIYHNQFDTTLCKLLRRDWNHYNIKLHGLPLDGAYWRMTERARGGSIFVTSDETKAVLHYNSHESSLVNTQSSSLDIPVIDDEAKEALHFLKGQKWIYEIKKITPTNVELLCTHPESKKPFMLVTMLSDKTVVQKVDEEGKIQPSKLVNLEALAETHPLYASTLQHAPHDEQMCFVNPEGEITDLHFFKIGLNFKRKGALLLSQEYDGYSLLTGTQVKALGEYSKHAFVLKHTSGKYKVLLPFPQVEKRLLEHADNDKAKLVDGEQIKYVAYDLSALDAPFEGETLFQKLFLANFFKTHGDTKRAFEYLLRADLPCPSGENFSLLLFSFIRLKETHSESIAFNMRLLLLVANRFSSLDKRDQYFASRFLQASTFWYLNYLRALDEIPENLRLSYGDEIRLLSTYKREEIELPEILNARTKLFMSKTLTAEIEIKPQKFNLHPEAFLGVEQPERLRWVFFPEGIIGGKSEPIYAPTRLRPEYIVEHFCSLYERAKKQELGFDLIALLRVSKLYDPKADVKKLKNITSAKDLASLLFYVHTFPIVFNDLKLEGLNEEKAREVWRQILWRVSNLKNLPGYQAVMDEVLAKGEFNYTKKVTLTLPGEAVGAALPPKETLPGFKKKPHTHIGDVLFKAKEVARPSAEQTLFNPAYFKKPTVAEKRLLTKFEEANQTLKGKTRTTYALQNEKRTQSQIELNKRKMVLEIRVKALKRTIDQALNDPFTTFTELKDEKEQRAFRLKMNSGSATSLNAEDIMREVILKNNTTFLASKRPMLKAPQIKVVIDAVHEYYHKMVLFSHCEEALSLLKRGNLSASESHELAEKLHYDFDYDPLEYPEIDYFKMMTGKLPRKEQLEIYKWVCEGFKIGENRLFQLPAGGGKTSFLIPLLILRMQRQGLLPVIFSTEAMYPIERANLADTLLLLGIKLHTPELDMRSELTLKKLRQILQDFDEAHRKMEAVMITPQTYYTLRLQYLMAAGDPNDQERAKILKRILNFFKEKCSAFIDESHRNLDPLTQAVAGVGIFKELQLRESLLLLELMKPLLGMSEVIGIPQIMKESSTIAPSKEEMVKVQRVLAENMAPKILKKLPKTAWSAFIEYWSDKKKAEPQMPVTFSAEDIQLIRLTRYFILQLMPQVASMRTDLDHIRSEISELDTPAHNKIPSFAFFENPYLAWLLTIKGTWHRGLDKAQNESLLKLLSERDESERKRGSKAITPVSTQFTSWLPTAKKKTTLAKAFSEKEDLHTHLKKHASAVEFYLHNKIRPQIGYASESITATPTDMMNGFKTALIFSATPLEQETYPGALKSEKRDPIFEAEVVAKCLTQKRFAFASTPQELFAQMKSHKETFKNVRALIDGGFWCDENNETMATNWLNSSDLDGVLYFDQKRGDKFSLRLKIAGEVKLFHFKGGSDSIVRELAAEGYQWSNYKIGVYFDAAHSESANIILGEGAEAIVGVSDTLDLSHLIQLIMRMRGFLTPHMQQTLIWALSPELKKKMSVEGTAFTTEALLAWALKNEARNQKGKRLMAASHGVAFAVESVAPIENIKGRKESIEAQSKWCNVQTKREGSAPIFWKMAEDLYGRFALATPFAEAHGLKGELKTLIESVAKEHPKILGTFDKSAPKNMHQKCIVKQTNVQKKHPKDLSKLSPEPLLPAAKVVDKNYIAGLKNENLARAVYGNSELVENFYIEPNQARTAVEGGVSLGAKFRKRIDSILVTYNQGKWFAEAHSDDHLTKVVEELRSSPNDPTITHKAFIVRADGVIDQRGTGALAPEKEVEQTIMTSPWMKNLLSDIAFLNRELTLEESSLARQMNWKNFYIEWGKAIEAYPYRTERCADEAHEYLTQNQRSVEMIAVG